MKILVVEDEMIISEDICMMLEERGYEVCGQAVDYDESMELLNSQGPDLALLDINLHGSKDGIEIAEKINELHGIPFIYTSSLGDRSTIERAKLTKPASYLVKPFKEEQLFAAIEVAMENFSMNSKADTQEEKIPIFNDAIFVKVGHKYSKVNINEIRYISKSDNYIELQCEDKKYLIRASLGGFIEQLGYDKIHQTHRSYAVNIDYMNDITPTSILIGKVEIPLSKAFSKTIMDKLKIF